MITMRVSLYIGILIKLTNYNQFSTNHK